MEYMQLPKAVEKEKHRRSQENSPTHQSILESYEKPVDMKDQPSEYKNLSKRTSSVYNNLLIHDLKMELHKVRMKCNDTTVNNNTSERVINELRHNNLQLINTLNRYQ